MKTLNMLVFSTLLVFGSFYTATSQENGKKEKVYYNEIDTMPEYPGGKIALIEFISKNLKYPENAKKQEITGKVFVSFVVGKNGGVSEIRIARGVNPELDAEAVRVVKSLAKWNPGLKNGEPVNVGFTLPIHFKLAEENKTNK